MRSWMKEPVRRETPRPEHVVVVGSGFGGYFAARKLTRTLDRREATVTVVSDTDGLLYQPLLPDVAIGALDPRAIVVPMATTLPKADFVRGHVTAIDTETQTITIANAIGATRAMRYDRLLIAAGGVTRMFDIPGLAEHAVGFKTIGEALYLRELVLRRMQQANDEMDSAARRQLLTFVVAGAGYAGTELVAQMTRLTRHLLPVYPGVRADDLRWVLVDLATSVMPELGPALGAEAMRVLIERGVDVRLGTSIAEVTQSHTLLTDGTRLDGATVVWCAGVTASPLVGLLNLPVRLGRLSVDADLSVPDHPNLYAVGDAAAVADQTGDPGIDGSYPLCAPTAQHAMRQGRVAARNVIADLRGRRRRPYRHRDLGLVVDLGGRSAVARPMGLALRGVAAKIVTRAYHLMALPTIRRRARVVLDWALAGAQSDDVAFDLPTRLSALAKAEHAA